MLGVAEIWKSFGLFRSLLLCYVKLGELILDKNELNTDWSVHASMLEEFLERGIILTEKKERFIKQFKNPSDFMCVFVVVPEGANFVFYPYI